MNASRFVIALGITGWLVAIEGCSPATPDASSQQIARSASNDEPRADASASQPAHAEITNSVKREPSPAEHRDAKLQERVMLKPVAPSVSDEIPQVFLSAEHSAMCRVRVGDELPDATLAQLAGDEASLSSLLGKKATVVLVWHPDRWMSETALRDFQKDVFDEYDKSDVATVAVAVETPRENVKQTVRSTTAKYPQLLDADGKFFAKLGMVLLPRVYVLDPAGKIVWFDIEYSESTRRELGRTLEVLAGAE